MASRTRAELLLDFGLAVRRLRLARGYSQEDFADQVGIHRTYMGDVERGRRNISLVNIGRIADALELPIASLMAEIDKSA